MLADDSDHPKMDIDDKVKCLVTIRAHHFGSIRKRPGESGYSEGVTARNRQGGQDPFGYLAMLVQYRWKELLALKAQSWWSELQHRLLIFVTIQCGHWRSGEVSDPGDPHIAFTHRAVVRLLRGEVSKTHPEEALRLGLWFAEFRVGHW